MIFCEKLIVIQYARHKVSDCWRFAYISLSGIVIKNILCSNHCEWSNLVLMGALVVFCREILGDKFISRSCNSFSMEISTTSCFQVRSSTIKIFFVGALRYSIKKMLWKSSQDSQKNTCIKKNGKDYFIRNQTEIIIIYKWNLHGFTLINLLFFFWCAYWVCLIIAKQLYAWLLTLPTTK